MTRRWRIAAASAIGTSHARLGTVCQDRHRCEEFEDRDGNPVVALVVADGAGSALHAEIGAQRACDAFVDAVRTYVTAEGGIDEADADTARTWFAAARRAVLEEAERSRAPPGAYNSTFVAAVLAERRSVYLQLGDGVMVVPDAEGGWCWVHWPQRGEFANTTFFVPDASAETRVAIEVEARRVDEIALMSDGLEPLVVHYATQAVHAPFFHSMFAPVRKLDTGGDDANLSIGLGRYLASPVVCERTDDDKTLVLASRLPVHGGGSA